MGTTSATTSTPCPCCGCTTGKHCYQQFTVTWNCEVAQWQSLAPFGSMVCQDDETISTGWVQVGSTCEYRKWVKATKCCTSDGDCSGAMVPADPDYPPCAQVGCCENGTCPIHCSTCCCTTYTISVEGDSCIDGTYDFVLSEGTDCLWQGDGYGISCSGPISEGEATIPAQWVMAFNGNDLGCSCDDIHGGFIFTAPATGDCPPTTGWALIENTCGDPSVTGTPAIGTITKSGCPV